MHQKKPGRPGVSKIRQQILRIFLFAAILPILLLGIFSLIQIRQQMTKHYNSQVEADGIRVNSILFDITTSMFTSSEAIINSKSCMSVFGTANISETDKQYYSDVTEALKTLRKNTAAISTIGIYTNNPTISDNDYITYMKDYNDQEWYNALEKSNWNSWVCINRTDRFKNSVYELALVRRIGVISQHYTAYLVITLDNNYLRNRLEQNSYQIMASVNEHPAFYASDLSMIQTTMPMSDHFIESYFKYTGAITIDEKRLLARVVTFRPYQTDDRFHILIMDRQAYSSIRHMMVLYGIMIFVATFVPSAIILLFSYYFSRRVTTLKTAMHQASLGDYNIIASFQGDDELSETFHDLQTTMDLIHEKEARYYESTIKEQKLINKQQQMEFEMLASQINPHFLYNTLETIRMQALNNGNRDVATSIKLLGKSMHYVLENTGTTFTTLARELEYVKTYLAIQKLRFGDRVNADFKIEDGLDPADYQILPLLLQPIVENAIIHGLEEIHHDGQICISIRHVDQILSITVSDNGIGLEQAKLDALRKDIQTHDPADTVSIGLYNINQRLHLFYGPQYTLTISSEYQSGTSVTINIPAKIITE